MKTASRNGALCDRYPRIQMEIKAGMYGPVAYWMVTCMLTLPMCVCIAFCALPPVYILLDLSGSSFFEVWMLCTARV